MFRSFTLPAPLLCVCLLNPVYADDDQLPIREITVFKDGHALIVHQGDLATDENGNATIDYVPTPVIGTFWAHSGDDRATLRSVTSGSHKVTKTRSAKHARELLQANLGAKVFLRDRHATYSATVVRADADSPLVFLRTDQGTKAIPAESIQDVTFVGDPNYDVAYTEDRNQLRLQLDWSNRKSAAMVQWGVISSTPRLSNASRSQSASAALS